MAFSGEVFSAFDNPEAVTYKVSKRGNKYLNSLWPELQANIPLYKDLWNKFNTNLTQAGAEINALKPQISSQLGSMFSGFIDPFTTSTQLQNRDLAAVNDITGRVGDYATRQTKLANTMLGGGRPMGSAAQSFLTNDVTRAALPLYQTVLAQNPMASAQLESDRMAQLAAKLGIQGRRLALPLVGADLPLESAAALRGMSSYMTDAGNELVSAFRNNMLGAGMEEGVLGQIGRAGSDVASSYGSMMGSYGGGSGYGGGNSYGGGAPTTPGPAMPANMGYGAGGVNWTSNPYAGIGVSGALGYSPNFGSF